MENLLSTCGGTRGEICGGWIFVQSRNLCWSVLKENLVHFAKLIQTAAVV